MGAKCQVVGCEKTFVVVEQPNELASISYLLPYLTKYCPVCLKMFNENRLSCERRRNE